MFNKRKIISILIDCLLIIFLVAFFIEITRILFAYINLSEKILFYLSCLISIIIIFYILPLILKKKETLGKKIALFLIKDENKKISWKEVILLIIILLIISFF